MTSTLYRENVAATLGREHEAARLQRQERMAAADATPAQISSRDFRTSEIHRTFYLSIGPRQGAFLYATARAAKARNIVEFGSSFGISTLYLAAAAQDNGGRVIGSEFHPEKVAKATRNLQDAGLSDIATIRGGDARETLADIEGPIDLLFLDGAKELYLPVLAMLEDRLLPGALVIADNADMLTDEEGTFLHHVGAARQRYVTALIGFHKGLMSHSVFLG